MDIIVAGHIIVVEGRRNTFLAKSEDAVKLARVAPGCIDFSVSPDIVDPNRVNIFEQWHSENELLAFRASGPDQDLTSLIEDASVQQFEATQQ